MPSLVAGIAGVARNAATALSVSGPVVALCGEERVTRTHHAGLNAGELPIEALDAVLAAAGRDRGDIDTYALAEEPAAMPAQWAAKRIHHHRAHAAASLTSSYADTAVPVCHAHPVGTSVWLSPRCTALRSAPSCCRARSRSTASGRTPHK
jgi:predicted NodU family carbamoyl transferase